MANFQKMNSDNIKLRGSEKYRRRFNVFFIQIINWIAKARHVLESCGMRNIQSHQNKNGRGINMPDYKSHQFLKKI